MTKKLTLIMDETVIEKAKRYAGKKNLSVSKLVEFFLSSLTMDAKKRNMSLSPITARLAGMVKSKNIDDKKVLTDALIKRHA